MTQKITAAEQDSRAAVLDGLEAEQAPAETPEPAPKTRTRTQKPTAPVVPAIYGQIVDVMTELQDITPDATGPEKLGGYKYISPALFMAHLRRLLSKHRVAIAPRVISQRVEVTFAPQPPQTVMEGEHKEKVTWRGGIMASRTLAVVEMEYGLFSAVDGSSMLISAVAESADTGDKALSKAMTTALKKAFGQALMVTTDQHGDVDYGDVEESIEAANARATLRSRGEQQREHARNGRKSPVSAPEPDDEALEATMAAEEAASDEESLKDPVVTNADTGEVADETPEPAPTPAPQAEPTPAPAPAAPAPSAGDSLPDAKKALREAMAERAKGDSPLDPLGLNALGEKLLDKQRPDWIQSADDIMTLVKAVKAGEKP